MFYCKYLDALAKGDSCEYAIYATDTRDERARKRYWLTKP